METGIRATLVKFSFFAVISVVLFALLFRLMTNTVAGETQEWEARFNLVSGLRVGDDVRLAGVKVGRVESIAVVENNVAEVGFILEEGEQIYDNTIVGMRYQNLLGQRYLSLALNGDEPGSPLSAGTTIGTRQTDAGFDLTALLNGFEPLFRVLEPAAVNKLSQQMIAVLQGESGNIESLLRTTAQTTQYLAGKDEVFGEVVQNLVPVLENLNQQSDRVTGTVQSLRELMTGLAQERKTFATTIDEVGGLVESTSDLLAETRPDIRRDVAALRGTTGLLVREQALLIRTLQGLPLLLGAFLRSTSYGGKLNQYLCNLGVDLELTTVWLGSKGAPYSPGCAP